MRRARLILSAIAALSLTTGSLVLAHCQVPCGIYNDPVRFELLREHIATIEKSIQEIQRLSGEEKPNYNQIVRWVQNKDNHADQFSEIVTYYFLAQRVKPADPGNQAASAKYVEQLKQLHEMVVYAMKCKQTTDVENCTKLRSLVDAFEASYLGKPASQADEHHHHDQAAPGHSHPHS
jgi:nickel superoxide dismutase